MYYCIRFRKIRRRASEDSEIMIYCVEPGAWFRSSRFQDDINNYVLYRISTRIMMVKTKRRKKSDVRSIIRLHKRYTCAPDPRLYIIIIVHCIVIEQIEPRR